MGKEHIIMDLIQKALCARQIYEAFTQEHIDRCVKEMCLAMKAHAAPLADEAVAESGYGNAAIKTEKNLQAPNAVWYALKGKKSVGVIGEDPSRRLLYVAKPVGTVAAIVPSTNPSTTIFFNACYVLKGGNAVIFSPHPGALQTSIHTFEMLRDALEQAGAPKDLIQYIPSPQSELTAELMAECDMVLVAGNDHAVKMGYLSGKPAIGVSHGNTHVILDRGINYAKAVKDCVYSCGFDNGLICACTQGISAPAEDRDTILACLKAEGAAIVQDTGTIDRIRDALFPGGVGPNRNFVGKSTADVIRMLQIQADEQSSILVLAPDHFDSCDPLLAGEMAPICLLMTYNDFLEAISMVKHCLNRDGKGHSAVIYSEDRAKIEFCALQLPVSRILVNQKSIYAANQHIKNGLTPTANLACGSWANNSLSENIGFEKFLNICRVAWQLNPADIPSPEEIWAEE